MYPIGAGTSLSQILFSPDSKVVALVKDSTAYIYETHSGQLVRHFSVESKTPIQFTKDNNWIYFQKQKLKNRIHRRTDVVEVVKDSLSEIYFYTGRNCIDKKSGDSVIIKEEKGSARFAFFENDTLVKLTAFTSIVQLSENGKMLAICADGKSVLYFLEDNNLLLLDSYGGKIRQALIVPGDKYFVTTSSNYATVWNIHTAEQVSSIHSFREDFECTINETGDRIVLWDGRRMMVYSLPEGKQIANIDNGKRSKVGKVFISADGKRLGATSGDISIYELPSGKLLKNKEFSFGISSYSFNKDATSIIVRSKDSIWVLRTDSLSFISRSAPGVPELIKPGKYGLSVLSDEKHLRKMVRVREIVSDNSYVLMPLYNNGHLVFDAYDRFDGTIASRDMLNLVCGEQFISKKELQRLYVPGLAAKLMEGNTIKAKKLEELKGCKN